MVLSLWDTYDEFVTLPVIISLYFVYSNKVNISPRQLLCKSFITLGASQKMKSEIVGLPEICLSFPNLPSKLISRDNILHTLDSMLVGDTEILVIEGEEGIGKTTLLAQFANRYPNRTISIFIKPVSKFNYDTFFLVRDLSEQLTWALSNKPLTQFEEIDISYLNSCYTKLMRKARNNNQDYFFILDGLHEIPDLKDGVQKEILDLLPIGQKGFKFLISGDSNRLPRILLKNTSFKSFPIVGFTLDETRLYLQGLNVDSYFAEIYHTCKGIPIHLASIKRILETDGEIDLASFVSDLPKRLPDLFDLEWKKVNFSNTKLISVLSIIAHDQKKYKLSELCQILKCEEGEICENICKLSFITLNEDTKEVGFITEAFRKFAENRLKDKKQETLDLLIDYMISNDDQEESLIQLPGYLEQVERYDELLNRLSPDNFLKIVSYCGSLFPLRQQVSLGVDVSYKLSRDCDLIRFSSQKGIINGIGKKPSWVSELEALMSLDDFSSALTLAQSSVLKEDLLYSLAVIAKKGKEKNINLGNSIIEQIKTLYNQIDPSNLGERSIEIASELIYTVPEIALDIVERIDKLENDDGDWAFARLSLSAFSDDPNQNLFEGIQKKIQNPKVKRFTSAASLMLGKSNAEQVISVVEKLENQIDGLYLLRLWASEKRDRPDAYEVVDYAINLSIKLSEYTPNADDFRKLGSPLPYIEDKNQLLQLISKFDSMKGSLIKYGPSQDYVRLQLIIAQAESKYDTELAKNRILEIYLDFIDDIEDLAIRTTCLAWIYGYLHIIDPLSMFEEADNLHSLVKGDLDEYLDILLTDTADHYNVTKEILRALAKSRSNLVLDIIKNLNTQIRRDKATFDFVNNLLELPHKNIDWKLITDLIARISNENIRNDLFFKTIVRIGLIKLVDISFIKKEIISIFSMIDSITDPALRCNAYGIAYSFLISNTNGEFESLLHNYKLRLRSSWEAIDKGWLKVNFGFKTTETLSMVSIDSAKEFYSYTEDYKISIDFSEQETLKVYLLCLNLSIRTFWGLLKRDIYNKNDIEVLEIAINRIPSLGQRVELWADIACGLAVHDRMDQCKQIVFQHIKPSLNNLEKSDRSYWEEVILLVAPSLFLADKFTGEEDVLKLCNNSKDVAISNICDFIFKKTLLSDPYEYSSGNGFKITYSDALDIVHLLSHLSTDWIIYRHINLLADTFCSQQSKDKFTREQKTDILLRLEKIVNEKLPDENNINHQGYKIIAQAQIYRMKAQSISEIEWQKLIDEAKKVNNKSDQVYILGVLSSVLPKKFRDIKKKLLEDASSLVNQIPATIERVKRLETLSRFYFDFDRDLSKDLLDLGMKFALKNDSSESYSIQRRIVDLAYTKFGPDFAKSIASIADDDPARIKAKLDFSEQLETKRIKQEIIDGKTISDDAELLKNPSLFWEILALLNADQIRTYHLENTRKYVILASKFPMDKAYPILSWVIQNAVKRFEDTNQASNTIKNIFNSLIMVVELAYHLSKRSSEQLRKSKMQKRKADYDKTKIFKSGERDLVLQFIRNWMEDQVKDYLKICDPYFGLSDLELVSILQEIIPTCKISILTSRKHQYQENLSVPWEDTYRSYWKQSISARTPPNTEIVIAGSESGGDLPIHDRWLITDGGGLRIGTSLGSLGVKKESEISILSEDELESVESLIDRYLSKNIREYDHDRLLYTIFTL